MRSVKLLAAASLALVSLAGCSAAPESDADLLEAAIAGDTVAASQDELPAVNVDLVFDGGSIVVEDGFAPQVVAIGGVARVNCATRSLKVTYREKNTGTISAATHWNRFNVAGNPSTVAPATGILPGTFQVRTATMAMVALPANYAVNAGLVLDSSFAVAEANEANNVFPFKLHRGCL